MAKKEKSMVEELNEDKALEAEQAKAEIEIQTEKEKQNTLTMKLSRGNNKTGDNTEK